MERITNIKVNALTGIEWNPVITGNTKSPRKVSLKIPENYKIQACPFIEETFESYKKEEAEIINFLNENNIPQTTVESERDIAAMFHQVRCEIDQFFPRACKILYIIIINYIIYYYKFKYINIYIHTFIIYAMNI